MKNTVYFSNSQKIKKITPELKRLMKSAVSFTLSMENFDKSAEVSISFVDNEQIHALNREYRNCDKPTDVLSFPMLDGEDSDGDTDPYNDSVILGDIVISTEKAQEQAEAYGHSFEREAAFLCVHSMLHLLGYDHENSEEEDRLMQEKQEEVLEKLGLPRNK